MKITPVTLVALGLIAAVIAATVVVMRHTDAERRREIQRWQSRLDLIVSTRASALEAWIEQHVDQVAGLARNPSVQLYMSDVGQARPNDRQGAIRRAQEGFLANLFEVSADRLGFADPPVGPAVDANVERKGVAGLALVDMTGRVLAASRTMPAIDTGIRAYLTGARRGRNAVRDIYLGADGRPAMAFAAPVFPVQSERTPDAQRGWIVGVRPVGASLARALVQPGETAASAQSILVRREGAAIRYLWPNHAERGPIGLTKPYATPALAATFAIETPGGFALRRDYRDVEVLIAARRVGPLDWTVAYKVDRAEALGPAEARFERLLMIAALAIAALGAAFVAVWRHGASRRARRAAERYAALSDQFEAQSRFLGLVNDAQPGPMFILDPDGVYTFANRAAGAAASMSPADMVGKTILSVRGTAAGQRALAFLREARSGSRAVAKVDREDGPLGTERVVHAQYIPLSPKFGLGDRILVVEHDVTGAVVERERRERTLSKTIDTLIDILDRRDPFAVAHSARVSGLAGAIAEEMALDEAERDTVVVAAKLMNIGKILISSQVLAHDAALEDGALQSIRGNMMKAADLLEGIEFEGPVVETLRHMQARFDGTGEPRGVAGTEIVRPARIIAVANAFVAMTSPRAYRDACGVDDAVDTLMSEAGSAYDRAVVAALVSHLDNHGGRSRLGRGAGRAA